MLVAMTYNVSACKLATNTISMPIDTHIPQTYLFGSIVIGAFLGHIIYEDNMDVG
jgi:hypothetical protein